jgi:hypothetical protein
MLSTGTSGSCHGAAISGLIAGDNDGSGLVGVAPGAKTNTF